METQYVVIYIKKDKMILRTVEQTQKLLNKHKQVMITNADKHYCSHV